jgi:hypothetical protein
MPPSAVSVITGRKTAAEMRRPAPDGQVDFRERGGGGSAPRLLPRRRTGFAAVPALPDRWAMESYLAAITGRDRNDAIAKAQEP